MSSKHNQAGFTLFDSVVTFYWIALFVGGVAYIVDIFRLAHMNFDHVTATMVLRIVGVVFAPLGAVMGFIPN